MAENLKIILIALLLPLAFLLLFIIVPAIDYALFKPLVDALGNVPWWAFFMFNHSMTYLFAHMPTVFWTIWGVTAVIFYVIVAVVLYLAFKYGQG